MFSAFLLATLFVAQTAYTADNQGEGKSVLAFPYAAMRGDVIAINVFSEGPNSPQPPPLKVLDGLGHPLNFDIGAEPYSQFASEYQYDYRDPWPPFKGMNEFICDTNGQGTCYRLYGMDCRGCRYPGAYAAFEGPAYTIPDSGIVETVVGSLIGCAIHDSTGDKSEIYTLSNTMGTTQILPGVRAAYIYGFATGTYIDCYANEVPQKFGWTMTVSQWEN